MECGDFLGTTSPEPDHNVLKACVLKIFCDQLDTRRFYYILLKLAIATPTVAFASGSAMI
jgi:hypothetical protein